MNITLSVDEKIAERARATVQAMGKSLNQMVREYLESLAHQNDLEAELEEFERLSLASGGDSKGWKLNREDIYDRPVLKWNHRG
jgi:DNA anti-recombination protein RmuC